MLEIFGQVKNQKKTSQRLTRLFNKARALGLTKVKNLKLIFVTAPEIKKLNQRYLGINKPTDVLAFNELNEIYLCPKIAQTQAQLDNKSLLDELGLLFAHGLLHLSGFDHSTKYQARKMELSQAKILGSTPNRQLDWH